ncbi:MULTISPECIES: hypothetical protein [unclassified Mesorhizobium]|uniref:hypothetical protein n=1 Tax=unclassified Mesorhizobium TaxID=325217 RepID=UPI001FE13F1E|nr:MULTISPECIES: hypothetical protein [unclassified Mesorhizobium]
MKHFRGEEDLRHASLRDFREEVGNEAGWAAASASLKMGKGNENASRRFKIDISHQRGLAARTAAFCSGLLPHESLAN